MKLLSLFFILVLTGYILEEIYDWELRKEKDGIKVYTRKSNSSNIKELKITTRFKGNLHSVIAVLDDVKSHPTWVYKCTEGKILDLPSEHGYYYYVTIDFPFPLIDRDVVIFTRKEQDPITRVVNTFSIARPDEYPEQDGFIRIRQFNSSYNIVPTADGYIEIEYQMFSDPGGHIPDWMVNMAVAKGPTRTMQNFASQSQSKKYEGVISKGIK